MSSTAAKTDRTGILPKPRPSSTRSAASSPIRLWPREQSALFRSSAPSRRSLFRQCCWSGSARMPTCGTISLAATPPSFREKSGTSSCSAWSNARKPAHRRPHFPSSSASTLRSPALAIELDGDQYHGPERWADDLARQRVMERVGWRFWRCWGSSFRLDPEGCLDDLVRALGSQGIDPMSAGEASTIWTDFRTTAPPAMVGFDELAPMSDAVLRPAAAILGGAPADDGENSVEIGDRVQVQVGEDTRVRVITLTAERNDPDLGIISVRHPAGAALIGPR